MKNTNNSRFFIVALLCSLLSIACSKNGQTDNTPSNPVKTNVPFRIATYNMRVDAQSDKFSWSGERKYLAANIIKKYDFDIMGTQELYYHQVQDVISLTDNAYTYIGVATGDGKPNGTESFDAIFFKKSRFKKLDTGDFWYSETPEVPSTSWGAAVRTHCTWAKLQDLKTDKIFFVFNSHFIYDLLDGQVKSAIILAERVKSIAAGFPVYCTGDYNATVNTSPIQTFLLSTSFSDAKALSSIVFDTKNGGTFSGFEKNINADWRIDLIMVNKFAKVSTYTVIQDDFSSAGSASDHLPVYIDTYIN